MEARTLIVNSGYLSHIKLLMCQNVRSHNHFQEEELKSAILAVLANKQDMEGAMTVAEVHSALGLDALKTRTFQIFKTSAIKGEGLDQAMDWLANALSTRK